MGLSLNLNLRFLDINLIPFYPNLSYEGKAFLEMRYVREIGRVLLRKLSRGGREGLDSFNCEVHEFKSGFVRPPHQTSPRSTCTAWA